jgi:hypothetical protein
VVAVHAAIPFVDVAFLLEYMFPQFDVHGDPLTDKVIAPAVSLFAGAKVDAVKDPEVGALPELNETLGENLI